MIRPFICTCDKRLDSFKKFIASYKEKAEEYLLRPIVYYDGTDSEYLKLIESINPIEMIEQGSVMQSVKNKTIDYKVSWEFPLIAESYSEDHILFLEDDILFSSRFGEAIEKGEKYINDWHSVSAITFFAHKHKYCPDVHNKAKWFFYRFPSSMYHGNLAVLFRKEFIKLWKEKRKEFWGDEDCGWDWKLSEFLIKNNKDIYCTHFHYVQHQIGVSAIRGYVKYKEYSSRFIK